MNDNEKDDSGITGSDEEVIHAVKAYYDEAWSARLERMEQNRENFDTYHLKQDFSHKQKGQSKEFLGKVAMSVEQIATFVVQGLADLGSDWFSVEYADGNQDSIITADEVKKILNSQLQKAQFYSFMEDYLKLALLGSLGIAKIDTVSENKPKYVSRTRIENGLETDYAALINQKTQRLRLTAISPRDWFPDPTGRGLYLVQEIEEDLHVVRAMIKSDSNPDGIYDEEAVERLVSDTGEQSVQAAYKVRETGQNIPQSGYRKRTRLLEMWGILIDKKGNVMHDNIVCTVANDRHLIRKPEENPFWHQTHPYVFAPLIRVPRSVWHKALMDAPTKHNIALNEIYNLALDNGLIAVWGIKQIRMDWLEDPSQVSEGIRPGTTLKVNSLCPPGENVLKRVDTALMAQEAIAMFNLTNGEFQQSSMTNDLRLGVLPQRAVKATEVVASEQATTGMLNGVAKIIEETGLSPILNKAWMTIVQNIKDFDTDEIEALIGKDRARQFLALSPAKRFAQTVNGLKFKVFGLTYTLNKTKDFRKYSTLLQTLGAVPALMQEFAKDYSLQKLVVEIMKNLDLNPDKLRLSEEDQAVNAIGNPQPGGAQGSAAPVGAGGPMSQVPQAASEAQGGAPGQGSSVQSISQPKLPPSRATGALK